MSTAALLLSVLNSAAFAEYRFQPGDVLNVALVGSPDFQSRLPIELDGTVALPLVGSVKAAGITLSQVRQLITRSLTNKVYEPAGPNQRQHLILPDEILVTVAEYRPIYVTGYVAKPGQYPFRPGLTVRQAVAMAGGYGPSQGQDSRTAPASQISALRGEYSGLSFEYASMLERSRQLRRGLGLTSDENATSQSMSSLPQPLEDEIRRSNSEYLKARTSDRQNDQQSYQLAVDTADRQLKTLLEKKQKDEEGVKADNQELDAVRELFHRGITANARLSEARRAALLSSDQLLQTIVQISNVERQRQEYVRQIEKLGAQAKIDGWQELQQASLRLAQIGSRMNSIRETLTTFGAQPAADVSSPKVAITRDNGDKNDTVEAADDSSLVPGDVITVSAPETRAGWAPIADAGAGADPIGRGR